MTEPTVPVATAMPDYADDLQIALGVLVGDIPAEHLTAGELQSLGLDLSRTGRMVRPDSHRVQRRVEEIIVGALAALTAEVISLRAEVAALDGSRRPITGGLWNGNLGDVIQNTLFSH